MTSSKWQALLDDIAREFDIHTVLTDAEGTIVQAGGEYNPLCTKVRETPGNLAAVCSQTNRAMIHEAHTTGKPVSDYCEAGLFKTVVPIFEGGELVNTVSACGLAGADEPPEAFIVSKILGIDEAEAERLVETVHVVDETKAQAVTNALIAGIRQG